MIKMGNRTLSYLISLLLIVNITAHYLENILGIGNTYVIQYFCWLLLALWGFVAKHSNRSFFSVLLILLVLNTFTPYITRSPWDVELHIGIVTWCSYCATACIKYRSFSQKDLIFIYKVIICCGIIVCLYAILSAPSYVVLLLSGEGNPEEYVSFLRQRNIFAAYCYVSSIPALYLYLNSNKKKYLWILILFGSQIFLTTSRNSLLCYGLFIAITLYLKTKNKMIFYLCSLLLPFAIYSIFGGLDSFYDRFRHETQDGTDSSEIRYMMWMSCFEFLSYYGSWLWGFGFGSINKYLTPIFDLGSSHNMYIDVVFWGGLIFLFIVIAALIYSFVKIRKNDDIIFKETMTGAIASYLLYGVFEASMTPFVANFFSVTITILIILIPLNYRFNK